jgi:hypothetical protein
MLTLALAVLLTLTDPGSDLGNGQVRPPTAAVGRPNGALDITQFQLYNSEAITFSLTLTSLANPFELKNGFTFPIIEIYIDDQSGTGSETLLPGSGMRLPTGASWKYAYKLTGDTLQVFEATGSNSWQDVTTRYPTKLTTQGTTLIVSSSVPGPEKPDFYGMVGSYNSFSETGWTPMSRSESPWAYSSETQIPAALDVIAPTFEAQQTALDTGVLPAIRPPRPVNPWIFVMVGGVLIAVAGVVLRFLPGHKSTPAYTPPAAPSKTPQPKAPSAQIGPYKPEPLKSRSAALKNIVGDKVTPLPDAEPSELTPGQLMAAERARAMIASDRKARDTGETLVDKTLVDKTLVDEIPEEPKVDKTVLADELLAEEITAEPEKIIRLNEPLKGLEPAPKIDLTISQADIFGEAKKAETENVSSTAIPLFQTPPRAAPAPANNMTANNMTANNMTANNMTANNMTANSPQTTTPKAQFAASDVWQEDEDEFDFLWAKKDEALGAKQHQPKKDPDPNT